MTPSNPNRDFEDVCVWSFREKGLYKITEEQVGIICIVGA